MQSDIVHIGNNSFPTLIAITPEEQSKGLMYRKWPPPVMCFPYLTAGVHKFWMQNTLSPLDIIFCKDNKIVSICYGEPLSTQLIGPNIPSDLVVELPHGTVSKCGISVGDDVQLIYSKQTIARDIRNLIRKIL